MSEKLHYLTVPDLVWLNLQLTKSPQKFHYATLEEGAFYQYAYGTSTDLFAQAARLLTGFAKLKPFASGNKATALAATAGFLAFNGQDLHVPDVGWVDALYEDPDSAATKLEEASQRHPGHVEHGFLDTHEILQEVLDSNEVVLEALVRSEPVAELI